MCSKHFDGRTKPRGRAKSVGGVAAADGLPLLLSRPPAGVPVLGGAGVTEIHVAVRWLRGEAHGSSE
jgi:hypothetical protein